MDKYKKITKNSFSPEFVYSMLKKSDDTICDKGLVLTDLYKLGKIGFVKSHSYRLGYCPAIIPNLLQQEALLYKNVKLNKKLDKIRPIESNFDAIKESICNNKPVIVGIVAKYYNETAKDDDVGHAICIIGYKDEGATGYFEYINSWGSSWSDWKNGDVNNKGFGRISYDDYWNYAKEAIEMSLKLN